MSLIFKTEKQPPLNKRKFGKTNIRHGKTACRFELHIGPGTAESFVQFNSTLDQ